MMLLLLIAFPSFACFPDLFICCQIKSQTDQISKFVLSLLLNLKENLCL